MTTSRRRRPPKVDTERAEAVRSCARHLKDLQRAQREFPASVRVSARGLPKFVAPILEQSYCTSPAALCAELAEMGGRTQSAAASDLVKLAELGAELTELDAELAELLK
jgi:hypothetical protein